MITTSQTSPAAPNAGPAAAASPLPRTVTADRLADVPDLAGLVDRLGGIPLERIHLHPWPGTATEADVVEWNDSDRDAKCELIDGTLVEKAPMAWFESQVAAVLIHFLTAYMLDTDAGKVFDASAMQKMSEGNIRIPDVSVYLNANLRSVFPAGRYEPTHKVAPTAPDVAVEVLSEANRPPEIATKRREFFASGTRLVWVVDPRAASVAVWSGGELSAELSDADTLDGGDVLPGFSLAVSHWFETVRRIGPA